MSADPTESQSGFYGRESEAGPGKSNLGTPSDSLLGKRIEDRGDCESGLLAEFAREEAWREAVRRVRAAGAERFEAFSPYPVEGIDELVLPRPSPMPAIMLTAGAAGAAGGFYLQVWAARDYPLQVGSRPLFSWPAFIPVTFELGVLTAVLVGIVAFLWRAGLPRYDHPAFASPRFARASTDRFFLWLPAKPEWRVLLATTEAEAVEEVRA
jgi:hypothetical protein